MTIQTFQEFLAADSAHTTLQKHVTDIEQQIREKEQFFRSAAFKIRELDYIHDILQNKMFDLENISQKKAQKFDNLLGELGGIEIKYEVLSSYLDKLEQEKIQAFVGGSENAAALEKLKTQLKEARLKTHLRWKAVYQQHEDLKKSATTTDKP